MTIRLGKSLALIFAIGALHLNLIAGPALMGKLKTRNNKPVSVNGNKASSGTTIFSGTQIQCPQKIGATVDLGSLGRLDMAPNTDLTLIFDGAKVDVQLKKGYVILTTKKGIRGTVTTSDGKVFTTDASRLSSIAAKTPGVIGPEASAIGAAAGGIGASGTAGIAGVGAAVVGGVNDPKASGRGSNLSTDNPREP